MPGRSAYIAVAARRPLVVVLATVLTLAALGAGVIVAAPGSGRATTTAPNAGSRAPAARAPLPAAPAVVAATPRGAPYYPPALRARWQAGLNLTANAAADFLDPGSDAALQAAARDHSTHVEVVATWYMQTGDASQVAADPARTPTDAAVMRAATVASSLGLKVLLKPQVDVRDGTYRGRIQPADRAAWFNSYEAMVLHYAQLAAQLKLEGLVVGVELGTMVDQPGDPAWWRGLIRSVRGAGFRGSLIYAANWDQLDGVRFWHSLDYIGIDAYFPLIPKAHQYSPTTQELAGAWHGSYVAGGPKDWFAKIAKLHRAQGRPVLFSELGYGATACTAVAPYELAPRCADPSAPSLPSERAQQNAYVAALRVWSRVPWVAGIYWWNWPTDANRQVDFYSPRGKRAEQSIALWNATRGALKG